MSTQPRVATSKHHEVVIPDAFPTQLSFGMTLVEGVIKFIVTIFSFAKAQRKMKWVQSQLQIALDRMDQIEDQIQVQNAFARGFMTGILAMG